MLQTFDHSRPDFLPYGLSCEPWQPRKMLRPSRHNEIELNFLLEGSLTYLLGGRRAVLHGGRLGAFWAAIPHQVLGGAAASMYWVVTLPLAWFLQCGLPEALVARLLRGELVDEPDARQAAVDAQLCARWHADLARGSDAGRRATLLEIEARLWRLAAAQREGVQRRPRRRAAALGPGAVTKVERMAAFVAQRYTRPLTMADVAREVGLHPNYAMTLFRRSFGTTLHEYLTQLRVSHAQRLLSTTDDKLYDVALSSGFGSLARFHAAFARVAGCAPGAYREGLRTGRRAV